MKAKVHDLVQPSILFVSHVILHFKVTDLRMCGIIIELQEPDNENLFGYVLGGRSS